jgi:hypothetical protein
VLYPPLLIDFPPITSPLDLVVGALILTGAIGVTSNPELVSDILYLVYGGDKAESRRVERELSTESIALALKQVQITRPILVSPLLSSLPFSLLLHLLGRASLVPVSIYDL